MRELIFKTGQSYAPLVLRILLAAVLFPHGAQKLLGWFGGFGFSGTMNFFTETMSIPWIISFLVIVLEFFGPVLLLLGLATRLVSGAITVLMLGILLTSHMEYGFFMNWFGNQKGEGIEYFILFLAGTISLFLSGGGLWSADRLIYNTKD
ncbi:DoxX family protein [Desertivirga brevis]|uniref:DoxX family protein n=1 Tax=Desertivirga brevis TaxID=2810310 RepID=UPI001A978EEE|nr:DoxX family protein [Pedobacter sp. SYSU D00873]